MLAVSVAIVCPQFQVAAAERACKGEELLSGPATCGISRQGGKQMWRLQQTHRCAEPLQMLQHSLELNAA